MYFFFSLRLLFSFFIIISNVPLLLTTSQRDPDHDSLLLTSFTSWRKKVMFGLKWSADHTDLQLTLPVRELWRKKKKKKIVLGMD